MFAMNHDWEKVKKENENLAAIEKKSERELESIRQRLTELRRQLELKRSALPALQSDLDEKMSKKAEVEREAEIEMERMFPNRSVFVPSETPQPVKRFCGVARNATRRFSSSPFPSNVMTIYRRRSSTYRE